MDHLKERKNASGSAESGEGMEQYLARPGISRLRLLLENRLLSGGLIAALPLLGMAIWLAWGEANPWLIWACGLVSLLLAVGALLRVYRPLTSIAVRARELAGLPPDDPRLGGWVGEDFPAVETITNALDRIEQSLQELQALNRIVQLANSDSDLIRILSAILEEAVALLHADAGFVGHWDARAEVFRDVAACNMPLFSDREFRSRESLSSEVAKYKKAIFLEDYSRYPYRIKDLERFRFKATMGLPLLVDGECIGALVIQSVDPKRRFTHQDGLLLSAFANQAGAAFEKARLYQVAMDQLVELKIAQEKLAREGQELEAALANMVRVQEEERARIAADVHDGVVQMMVGGLCELQAAMARFPQDPDFVRTRQERARVLIRDSITQLRRVIFDLRPTILDNAGLLPAIKSLMEDFRQMSEINIEVHASGMPCRFSPEIEIGAYRIVQEAVNNATKHAHASSIQVNMRFTPGELEFRIRDDGLGFSIDEALPANEKKAGLIGMKERARSLGGSLSLSSTPGLGTQVLVNIPCMAPHPTTAGLVQDKDVDCLDSFDDEHVRLGQGSGHGS